MRSIPLAITWEMLNRGRWNLILGFLGANLLPTMLLSALTRQGADLHDSRVMMIHSTLMLMYMTLFGLTVLSAQGPPSRLYSFPVPSSTLVACHLIPAMVLIGIEILLSTMFLNSAFDLKWPLLSPALFAATAVGLIQTTIWFTEKSAWLALAMGLVASVLGVWYHYRFSRCLFEPTQPWIAASSVEAAILFVATITSFIVGNIAMKRNRCGEQLKSLGIAAWIQKVFDVARTDRLPFSSPMHAQAWFEWQLKGWAIPTTTLICLAFSLTIWLIFVRDPKELMVGFVAGGGLLSAAAFVWAIIIGNVGTLNSNFEMGQFLASRPITSSNLARAILRMTAKSVLLAWIIWAVAFLILAGILLSTGLAPVAIFPKGIGWWYFPLTLFGCWTVASVIASIVMTGRVTLFARIAGVLFAMYLAGICLSAFTQTFDEQERLVQVLTTTAAVIFVVGTGVAFAAAWKHKLIEIASIAFAICVWGGSCAAIVLTWIWFPTVPFTSYFLFVGLAALVVAPFAAAPLAITWNRNR